MVPPQVVRDLAYSNGLAQIAIAGRGWFYRLRNGRMASVLTFDVGPDPFQEGLARQNIDGHIVYIDRHLNPRIVTRYDLAAPFDHGRADVCSGCRELAVEGDEHQIMAGGIWGVIDRRGDLVIPLAPRSGIGGLETV